MLSITDRLAHPGNPLHGMVVQARYFDAIGKALAEYLGPPANEHCRLATVRGDKAVLCVDSPVWYSKLRFRGPEIVGFFRSRCRLEAIAGINIHVDPLLLQHTALRDAPPEKRPGISPGVASLLRGVATTGENPALTEAWLRLARNERADP